MAGLNAPLPPELSPVIVGWTLGQIIGLPPYEWPVAPATLPDDVNLRSAFLGLVHHALVLEGMAQPWPEMMQTSMYWRGYGIAEALKPDASEGSPAILQLLQEARPLLSQHLSTSAPNSTGTSASSANAVTRCPMSRTMLAGNVSWMSSPVLGAGRTSV